MGMCQVNRISACGLGGFVWFDNYTCYIVWIYDNCRVSNAEISYSLILEIGLTFGFQRQKTILL